MDFFSPSKKPDKQEAIPDASFAFTALLKNTFGNKLLTFFDEMVKPALQRNEQEIAATYKKINNFIEEVHEHVQKKLEQHEQQVYQIVKQEMAEAHREVKQLASDLNKKIAQKNQNEEVWFLSNQLDYFKNEALKLFSINKELKIQNKLLAKTIKDYEVQFQSFDLTLQKLKKQSMKQKSIKRIERPPETMREPSSIKLRKKQSQQAKKRMVTELSAIIRTEVQKTGKEFDDSRINIQLSHASNGNFSNQSVCKPIQNNPILITLEDQDRSVENVIIPNLSAHSYKSKKQKQYCPPQSFLRPNFLQERPILQCFDKETQTDMPIADQSREELLQDTNQGRNNYDLNLFRNGFRLNATHMKTRRIEIPLRNSVDYERRGNKNNIRSMNSSFLRNRLDQGSKPQKKGLIFKQSNPFIAK